MEIPESGKVLTSGIDSLVLSANLEWRNDLFFRSLSKAKEMAAKDEAEVPVVLQTVNKSDISVFNVRGHGKQGYEWLFGNHDYVIKLTKSMKPGSRPSAMVEIRSETIWRLGIIEAVDRILQLLNGVGAHVLEVKASRADLCLDILLPESFWRYSMLNHLVTRATYDNAHRKHRKFNGLTVGKGILTCRIYNKGQEISTVSHKDWMLDVWELQSIPETAIAARVEFQLRRESLTELGIDTVWSLFNHGRNLWGYCTQKWLKLVDNAELHHTQHDSLPWWKTVQESWLHGPKSHPLIRAKSIKIDKRALAQQMLGHLSSLIAIDDETGDISADRTIELSDHISKVEECAELISMDSKKLGKRVTRKLAKYVRTAEKLRKAELQRKELGLPLRAKNAVDDVPI
jgi:hypothetical protein